MKHPILIRSVSLLLALVMLMAYPASAAEIAALTDEDTTASDSSDPFDDSTIEEATTEEETETADESASDVDPVDETEVNDESASDADTADETETDPVYLDSDGNYLAPETLVVYVNSYLTEGKDARTDTSYTGIVAFYDYNETDEEEMLDNPYFFYYEDGVLQDEEELYISSDRFLNLTSAPTTAAAASISDVDEDAAVYSAEEVYVNYRDEEATEHPDYLFAFNVDGQANGLYTGYSDVMTAAYDGGETVVVTGVSLSLDSDGKNPTLSWSAVSGASSYMVYRKTSGSWAKLGTVTSGSTSYTDSKATSSGTTYSYYVTAVLSGGSETSASDTVTYTCYKTSSSVKAANSAGGVKVTWSKVSGATGYRVLRQTSGSSTWTTVADITSGSTTSYVDSSASSGKTYSYAVRAYFGSKSSSREKYTVNVWSDVSSSASLYYLAAPTLGNHYSDASGMHVVWSKVSGASGYRVYRKTSASGSWTRIATITSGSTKTYLDTSAKEGGTYYYTVRAYTTGSDGTEIASAYYSSVSATVYYGIPTVTLQIASTGIKVSWTKDSAATGYRVYRKVSGESWTTVADITRGSTNSYVDTTVVSGTTYYYTVRAYYGSSISSASGYTSGNWSGYKRSSGLCYVGTPSLKTPYSVDGGMQITWSAVSKASGYRIYRRTSTTASWTKVADVTGSSTTSYLDTTAKANTSYYYTVRAFITSSSGSRTYGAYLTPTSASTYHATPTVTVSAAASGPKVSWTKDSTATGYRVYRKVSGDTTWTIVANITSNSTTSYVDSSSSLSSGKTYYYTVRAYYGTRSSMSSDTKYTTNKWSGHSPVKYVYLSTPTVPATLSNNATDTNGIKVTWSKVSGAAGYYIYRKSSATGTWTKIATISSGSTTVYLDTSVTKLASGTTCYYTVRAFSSGKTFQGYYDTTGSVCVYLPMPEDLAVDVPTSSGTKITWSKVSGATSYIVYRRKSTSSSWSGKNIATVTTNSYTDTAVTSQSTTYYYTVVAVTTATVNGKTVTFRSTYDKTGATAGIAWSGSERDTWVKKDGKQYYVESNGILATGWQYKTRNGSTYKYYFDTSTGELVTNLYVYFGKSYRDVKYRIITCVCADNSTPSYTAIYLYNSDTDSYDIPAASWRSIGSIKKTVARWSSLYLAANGGQRWLTGDNYSYEQYAVYIHGTPSWFHSVLFRGGENNHNLAASTYNRLEDNRNESGACIRMQSIYAFLISDLTKNGYGKTHRTPVVLYKTSSISAFGVPHLNKISTSRKTDPTDPDITGDFFYATTLYGITTTACSTTWVYY